VPYSIGGDLKLESAWCESCPAITGLRHSKRPTFLGPHRHGLPARRHDLRRSAPPAWRNG